MRATEQTDRMPIELRYRVVDVFTERPLAGNALCVVLDPCPDPVMQAIAREVNLSETTFPTVVARDEYHMRIFTPGSELPFAGHPSVGTAWVLGPGRWTQRTSGAIVSVDADEHGAVMTQPDPEVSRFEGHVADDLGAALGLKAWRATELGAWKASAAGNVHAVVTCDEPIDRLHPSPLDVNSALRRAGALTLAVVRRIDDANLHVRVFVPGAGIPEDPATGSAAGPVAIVARDVLGSGPDVTIRQGAEIGRPSFIEVHAEPGNIRVGGRVAAVAEGRFTL